MDRATDHTPHTDRYYVLIAICLAALVLPLSFTGGAVATPAIGKAFDADPAALTWITNAFMLSFGSLLMAAGSLSDLYGRKRLFTLGLALFGFVSILLANVSNIVWLDALRAVQELPPPLPWPAVPPPWPRSSRAWPAHARSACWAPRSAWAWRSGRCSAAC